MDHLWFCVLCLPCFRFCSLLSCGHLKLLALVCNVYCDFVTFPFGGILGQVWYLIVSIPDHYCLSYFH